MSTPNVQAMTAFVNLKNWQQNNQKLDELELSIRQVESQMDNEYVAAGATPEAEKAIIDKYGSLYEKVNNNYNQLASKVPQDYNLSGQIPLIAQGEIEYKDKNKDNLIDFTEYALSELADLGKNPTQDELLDTIINSSFVFDSIDTEEFTKEADGFIDQKELEKFYKKMDGFMSINNPVFQEICADENGEVDWGFVDYLCEVNPGMVYEVTSSGKAVYGHQSDEQDGIICTDDVNDYIFVQQRKGMEKSQGQLDKDRILGAYKEYLTQK